MVKVMVMVKHFLKGEVKGRVKVKCFLLPLYFLPYPVEAFVQLKHFTCARVFWAHLNSLGSRVLRCCR